MAVVGIRELSRDTSRVIKEFEKTGEPVIVTREGRPIGALVPVDQRQVEDIVLATAPELRRGGPDPDEDEREYSAAEVAEAIGAPLPEESEVASVDVSVVDLVSEHLASLKGVFEPKVFAYVEQAAARAVEKESDQVLQEVAATGAAVEDVRHLRGLNADLYGQLFAQTMLEVLSDEPRDPKQAVELAATGTSESLRAINQQILERSDTLDAYGFAVQIWKDIGSTELKARVVGRPRRAERIDLNLGRRLT